MAAEEHGLPPVIAKSIPPRARQITAFWVVCAHTRLVILQSAVLGEAEKNAPNLKIQDGVKVWRHENGKSKWRRFFFRPKNSAALIEDPFLLHTFIICSCTIILPIILVLTFVYVSEVIFCLLYLY